ncbi:MAG: hypothetical protein PHU92_01165 [Candidatus Shapirobacteria bacterium]|nr:hypothetical protein [Candidatus Shapirobacteria bacterium]
MSQNQGRPVPAIEIVSLAKIILVIFLVILAFSQSTDADVFDQEIISGYRWQATTLEFSQLGTANNTPASLLFNVGGFLPGGFEVRAIRIRNEGKMSFNYSLWWEKTAGDDQFCRSLKLIVMKDWQIIFDGFLSDLSLDARIDEDNKQEDWVFFLRLDAKDSFLKERTCDFDFVFRTFRDNKGEAAGFFDENRLSNHATSGHWADN